MELDAFLGRKHDGKWRGLCLCNCRHPTSVKGGEVVLVRLGVSSQGKMGGKGWGLCIWVHPIRMKWVGGGRAYATGCILSE